MLADLGLVLLLASSLVVATGVGFFINSRLKEDMRFRDSMEMVGYSTSLLATFTAIVLGMLMTSVKSSYDAATIADALYSGDLVQLDRCLADFRPETETGIARTELRTYLAAVIASSWPEEPVPPGIDLPDVLKIARTGDDASLAALLNDVGLRTMALEGRDEPNRNLAAACRAQYANVLRSRWSSIENLHRSISPPFLGALGFWLTILFASFGLRAPPHRMSIAFIGLAIASVAVAVLIILDMDKPYGGMIGVSSGSMRAALATMMSSGP